MQAAVRRTQWLSKGYSLEWSIKHSAGLPAAAIINYYFTNKSTVFWSIAHYARYFYETDLTAYQIMDVFLLLRDFYSVKAQN